MKKYEINKRIKYIKHKRNKGGSAARNTGIKNSTGEYITFLDDDDFYDIKKIEKQYFVFKNSDINNLGLVYCGIKYLDEELQTINRKEVYVKGHEKVLIKHLQGAITSTDGVMIKKNVYKKAGFFNETLLCVPPLSA